MQEIETTRETFREFLTTHENWVEVSPDVFECCVEDPHWPCLIELDSEGATFTFRHDTTGDWGFMAGESRRCVYKHLHLVPVDSFSDYAGSLMMDIQVRLLPVGQPLPERKPCPPDFQIRCDSDIPPDIPGEDDPPESE